METTTNCGICGAGNPAGARFCCRCGRPLGTAAAAPGVAPPAPGGFAQAGAGSMAKPVLLALAIAVLVALAAAAAMPLVALQGVRDALVARDLAAFNAAVDPDKLRSNLAARVHQRQAQTGAAAAPGAASPLDRLTSSDGLVNAICTGSSLPPATPPPPCEVQSKLGDVRFESPNRFSAAVMRSGSIAATLVFERQGLHWRITDAVLPPAALD